MIQSRYTRLLFILLTLSTTSMFAQHADSLKLTQLFSRMMLAPHSIPSLRKQADQLYAEIKADFLVHDVYFYSVAKFYIQTEQLDSGKVYAAKGLKLHFSEQRAYKTAKFYNLLASVSNLKMDYEEAMNMFQKSVSVLEEHGDRLLAARIKNNIGNTYFSFLDYESA